MDGYLKIKTKIDNSGVDKEIRQLEDKIKKLQTDNSNQSQKQSALQSEIDNYEDLCNQADAYKYKLKELENARDKLFINGRMSAYNLAQYDSIASEISQSRTEQTRLNNEIDKQSSKIKKVYADLDKVKAKISENNAKISEFKARIDQVNVKNIKNDLNDVGRGITSQISKLGKMAMAVVGIRTAFMAVRGAVNLVRQYNSQVATDFEYMGFCIANVVAPAVQKLIQLLYTVLSYVNAITTAWFGINLFSGSSAKQFQKMQNSASGTSKAVKEIQKSLSSFDEMNVLSDNSSNDASNNSGTTAGGVVSPSMDLSGMQAEVPAWLQWIIDNKELITSTLAGIAAGILSVKFGLGGIKALGIGILVTGVIKLIQDLIKYLNDPSWKNFGSIISDIGLIILGLGVLIGNVPLIIGGAIATIVGLIVSNWEDIKDFLQKGIDWLLSKVDWVRENFGIVGEFIYKAFIEVLQGLLNTFEGFYSGMKTGLEGLLKVFKGIFTGDMKTVLEGFKQIFKGVFDSLWSLVKYPLNLIIKGLNSLIRGANKIHFDVPDWVPGFGGMTFGFNIKEIPLLAKGTVLTRPTPVIAGEAGAEAIMPLENNLEWLDVLADKLASRIGSSGGQVNVYLDGRLIQRHMAKRQQQLDFTTNR